MEVRIYNNSMSFRGIIENQTSFLWNRKYNDSGSFSLKVPITPRNTELLRAGNIVWVRDKAEAGIIESLRFVLNHGERSLQVDGRFLDAFMARRLIRPQDGNGSSINFEGTVEDAMRTFFNDAAALPMVELEERHGYTEEVSLQASYDNLLEYEQNLAKSAAYGLRFRPDFVEKKIVFEIYKGLDHTKSQNDRTRVVFSEEFANLNSIEYTYNDQVFFNVCYVEGEGQDDTDPQKLYVVVGDTESTGFARREKHIEGKTQSNGLTIAQYRAKLEEEGRVELDNSEEAESVNCVVNPYNNFIYGVHYDLGDIVTVEKKDWGLTKDFRITSITEVYESEIPQIEVTLGTPLADKIKWR